MNGIRAMLILSRKELRLLGRDWMAAGLLFAMPAVLILSLSLALEDVYSDKLGTKLKVVVTLEDDGPRARAFRDRFCADAGFEFIARPAALDDAELFRTRTAHAIVRIPKGFSTAAESLFTTATPGDLGRHRIGWSASPTLDASYRWLLQSQLAMACAKLISEELAAGQERLGNELERVGSQLQRTGAQLEATAAQMQGIAAKLEGDPDALRQLRARAAAESAAAREAAELRAELGLEPAAGRLRGAQLPSDRATLQTGESPVRIGDAVPATTDPSADPAADPAMQERIAARGPAAGGAGTNPTSTAQLASLERGAELFLRQESTGASLLPSPLQQTVPGWALFAMFFIVVPLAQSLHRERNDGTIRRMLTLAVPRPSIVLGKVVPYVVVGMIQFAGMLAVGLWLVPQLGSLSLETGAHPWVLLPITLASSFAATGYGLLVATWSRTAERAAAFGATSVVILSVLGGVMVPHFLMPAALQKVAVLSPLYWGQQAYLDAFLHGAGLREVAPALGALTGFGGLCMLLSVRRIART